MDATDCIVRADPIRLKQIFINLLSNAIKYNHKDGHVKIYNQIEGDVVRVYVEDNGVGIDKSDVVNLFKPFSRLTGHTFGNEGTGIGLFISKKLSEAMGGRIGVESEKGQGATFWFELKLDNHLLPDTIIKSDPNQRYIATDNKKFTVLCVEDNPVNMMLMEKILSREPGIELLKAFTPNDAIELVKQHNVDLFLMDINLPEMSGFELLEHFRKQEATQNTKAIAISANAMDSDIQKGLEKGFTAYITKPIIVDEFVEKIFTVLND